MDRLAITQEQKIVEIMFSFPFQKKIETMERLPIIQEQKNP